MPTYNWQQKDWPQFRYDLKDVEDELHAFAEKAGDAGGLFRGLPDDVQAQAVIDTMVAEALKTSAIEGEYFSRKDVFSSVKKNLGLLPGVKIKDKKAAGIGELMVAVRNTYKEPLTEATLFAWNRMVMAGTAGIATGCWRTHTEPMQIISGAIGKIKIHFEAPPSSQVPKEMKGFVKWFNDTAPGGKQAIKKAPVRAALAHLYFESIHPFEDGNGRVGRALAEKALSQSLGRPVLLSLSKTIEAARKDYYAALQEASYSNEVMSWVSYFVTIVLKAQIEAGEQIEFTLKKTRFFDRFKHQLNNRQEVVLKRMLEEGSDGFEGGMNAGKYVSIAKTSKATATRDLQYLTEIEAFTPIGGRSTRYQIKLS